MANHVYFTINIEGLQDEQFQEHVKFEERTAKRYDDTEYTFNALLELEEQPFMQRCKPEFDEDGNLKDSYDWYCENVGAKWCHVEECEYGYIAGYSAWRQPHELVLNILEFYANKYDVEVSASMTYEDEFRNFMGKQYYGTNIDFADEGWYAVEGDYTETDGNALVEQFSELYPSINTEDDDFWYNEYEVDGEKIYPNEVIDELADEFWESC